MRHEVAEKKVSSYGTSFLWNSGYWLQWFQLLYVVLVGSNALTMGIGVLSWLEKSGWCTNRGTFFGMFPRATAMYKDEVQEKMSAHAFGALAWQAVCHMQVGIMLFPERFRFAKVLHVRIGQYLMPIVFATFVAVSIALEKESPLREPTYAEWLTTGSIIGHFYHLIFGMFYLFVYKDLKAHRDHMMCTFFFSLTGGLTINMAAGLSEVVSHVMSGDSYLSCLTVYEDIDYAPCGVLIAGIRMAGCGMTLLMVSMVMAASSSNSFRLQACPWVIGYLIFVISNTTYRFPLYLPPNQHHLYINNTTPEVVA